MIGLVITVLLTFFWNGKYDFSAVGIGTILGNGYAIQGPRQWICNSRAKICCITSGE